ncbi:hypothetical protein ACM66B_006435 [Microbotryomycetes sp. NB124-2]
MADAADLKDSTRDRLSIATSPPTASEPVDQAICAQHLASSLPARPVAKSTWTAENEPMWSCLEQDVTMHTMPGHTQADPIADDLSERLYATQPSPGILHTASESVDSWSTVYSSLMQNSEYSHSLSRSMPIIAQPPLTSPSSLTDATPTLTSSAMSTSSSMEGFVSESLWLNPTTSVQQVPAFVGLGLREPVCATDQHRRLHAHPFGVPRTESLSQDALSETQTTSAGYVPEPPAQPATTLARQVSVTRSRSGTNSIRKRGRDVGLSLGDFEILDTLGTGTFGRVLLTRSQPRSRPGSQPRYFALKVLEKITVVRLRQVEHLNSERSTLAEVSHPFIVNLFFTFQDEANLYLLLEFVQGGELFSHLRRAGRFSPDVSRFYASNIILALEYLHARDIVYRDLKPENLLIDSLGYLKIADFGFAKRVQDRTFTLCGTPEYLAPEIINATGHGVAADWWALGVLIFELLCGFPPFFADHPLEIYERILHNRFSFPPHVDSVGRDLIRRLLTADLTKRLGNLKHGARDVKYHHWFEGVDWAAVEHKRIRAPIIPVAAGAGDVSNFERYPRCPVDALPDLARARQAQHLNVHASALARGPDPYGHLFPDF